MYKSLNQEADKDHSLSVDTSRISWKAISLKVSTFIWKILLDRIATKDNLTRIGLLPKNNGECVFCQSCHKTAHHLFLECPFTGNIWARVGQ